MTTDVTAKQYEMEIEVLADDIDQLGHVNNVVYLRWVQDVAIAHWTTIASEEEKANLVWVVSRHEIDYKRPAFAGDVIIARTWIGVAVGKLYERHTELLRRSDRKLLAKVRTLWCPVDPVTKRPVEVTGETHARFQNAHVSHTG